MKRVFVLLLLGTAGWGAALLLVQLAPALADQVQLAASDFCFVRAGGPRLGRRPARQDIALVLYDKKTADQIGYVHQYEFDAKLYRALAAAGAKIIFDTRMVATASAEEFQKLQPLLDEMLTIRGDGTLLRDVWLSAALLQQTHPRYDPLIAQNVVNSHPHAVPSLRARLYPLVQFNGLGPGESAPLLIARRVWNLSKPDATQVGTSLRESGIMSAWHRFAPELVPKTDLPPRPYPVGQRTIEWHTFATTTSLVPPVGFWVSYDPPLAAYARHSYIDVLQRTNPQQLAAKIAIVGFDKDLDPSSDTYEVPSLAGKASAAEVVACAVQTLLDGRMFHEVPRHVALGVMAVMTIGLTLLAGLLRPLGALAATAAVLLAYYLAATWAYRAGWYVDCAVAPASGLLGGIVGGSYGSWTNLRARQRVVDLFGRYVPRAVVSQLIQKPELEALRLGGVKRDVSVLFADIRGFTTFSQDLPPEEVLRQLNALLEIMVECTFEHEGTLDKFIGDCILVLFNAPLDQPDHVQRAVRTAARIQQRLVGHPSGLAVGIGVHRGEAVVGNIGAAQRMEYTAIGSTVNIASRLCSVARSGQVIVSKQVADALDGTFSLQVLEPVKVKGISEPLAISMINTDA